MNCTHLILEVIEIFHNFVQKICLCNINYAFL